MTEGKTPQTRSCLYGPIDTPQEVELILTRLKREGHLKRFLTEYEIQKYLLDLKTLRASLILSGTIDTPQEVELFLSLLRKEGLLLGPIDTPEEVQLFIDKLQKEGLIITSFSNSFQHGFQNPPDPESGQKKLK